MSSQSSPHGDSGNNSPPKEQQAPTPSSIYLQPKINDDLEVDAPESYQFIRTIGDGSFGKVKLGIHKLTGEKVAIKILCKQRIKEKTDIERISRQIKIMKAVRHPFVIQMYEIIQSPRYLFLIMEYIEGGDLFDAISQSSKLGQTLAQLYFSQIVLGLEYLHGMGITHRDMKPENILIGEYGKIKIADFGLGNFFTEGQTLKTACGSPCYAPPEMLNQEEYNPRKVDMWSSGIILYAMVHGYLPFEDDIQHVLYEKIKTKNARIASSVTIPCRSLIRGLLIKDQKQRWSINALKEHQFLAESIAKQEEYVKLETAEVNRGDFQEICEHLGIMEDDHNRLFNNIRKNKHNNLTTLYYLGKRKILRKIVEGNLNEKKILKQEKQEQEKEVIGQTKEEMIQLKDDIKDEEIAEMVDKELSLEHRPFSFAEEIKISLPFVKAEEKQIKESVEQKIQETAVLISEKQKKKEVPLEQQNANTPESVNLVPSPRQAPKQFILEQEKSIPKKVSVIKQETKNIKSSEKIPPISKNINTHGYQHSKPVTPVSTKNLRKVPQSIRKSDIQDKPSSVAPKNQLKKSQRVIMYKPKEDLSKLNESQVKLYERSQSKDKPIVLKNNLRNDRSSLRDTKQDQCQVTFKMVHSQPQIVDAERLVLCPPQQLAEKLFKKGFSGNFQYFSYNKGCLFITKCQLRLSKQSNKSLNNQLQKVISQINHLVV